MVIIHNSPVLVWEFALQVSRTQDRLSISKQNENERERRVLKNPREDFKQILVGFRVALEKRAKNLQRGWPPVQNANTLWRTTLYTQ